MRMDNESGFTMIEIAVSLMIVAILAAILTPLVGKYVDEARVTRATQEAQSIADAILNFQKNTGKWPIFTDGNSIIVTTTTYQVLYSPGAYPATCDAGIDCGSGDTGWQPATGKRDPLANHLEYNKPGGGSEAYTITGKFAWRGPYVTNLGSDPWNGAYLVTAGTLAFGVNKAAFVLSAGPNSRIDTKFSQPIGTNSPPFEVGGDDIVSRIR